MADIVISLDWGNVAFLVGATGLTFAAAGKWVVDRTTKGFDSFTEQKMKNLATHQDIQKLVDQVRETERVKAEITDRVWDRQAQWKARREQYEIIIRDLSALRLTLQQIDNGRDGGPYENDFIIKGTDQMCVQISKMDRSINDVARLFISDGVHRASEMVLAGLRNAALTLRDNPRVELSSSSLEVRFSVLLKAMREDLGYQPPPNESVASVNADAE